MAVSYKFNPFTGNFDAVTDPGVVTVLANCLAGDAVGNCVKITGPVVGGLYQVATVDVTDPATLLAVGVILSKSAPTACVVQLSGPVTGIYVGLTAGRSYFASLAGTLSLVPPAPSLGGIAYVQSVGIALSADTFLLQTLPPVKSVGNAIPPVPSLDTQSVVFDGVNEILTRTAASVLGCEFNHNQPFSVNTWMRGTTTAGVYLVSKQAPVTARGWAVGFYLGQPLFFLSNDLPGNIFIQEAVSQTTLTGAWKMITWVYDGSGVAAGCTTYINGTSSFPVPSALTYKDTLGGNTTLGAGDLDVGRFPGGNYFPGSVADLSVWSKELSAAEVTTLYNQGSDIAGKPLNITGYANLDGWWRMGDEVGDSTAAGGTIKDASGNVNDLSAVNMVAGDIVLESPGEAFWNLLSLGTDGIDERVNMGSVANFSGLNQTFSAAVWFKTSVGGTADIFGKWFGLPERDWVIFLNGGLIQAHMNTSTGPQFASTLGTFNDGAWHLAVISWDGATLAVDVDGGSDRQTAAVPDRLGNTGSDVLLGARDGGGGTALIFYNGRFDEASFYNVALSAAQCIEMYGAGKPIDLTVHSANANLLHWWRCGDATFDGIALGQASVFDVVGSSDGFQSNMDLADLIEDVP